MEIKFCDRCKIENKNNDFTYLHIEIIPSKFRYKKRDYCPECFDIIAEKLDEKLFEVKDVR